MGVWDRCGEIGGGVGRGIVYIPGGAFVELGWGKEGNDTHLVCGGSKAFI